MKALLLFVILAFTVVTSSHATPAPRSKSSLAGKNGVARNSSAKGEKNGKANKKSSALTRKYKVRSGDSLYTIARRNNMRQSDLLRLNGLKSSRLKPGQILLLAGKAKKSTKIQDDEIVEESGQVISEIALLNKDGLFADSLAEVGVEPIARTYLSIPYHYGAQSRKSTDCSGFVQQVFREFDIKLPRTAREQYTVGMKINRASLASGDLLFFRTRARKKYPTHVGIYLGNGKMIHASSRQHKVVIADVNDPYYVKRFVGAKRTATFLPGEIDLEMLARQVNTVESDVPLAAAITSDVREELEPVPSLEASLNQELLPGTIPDARDTIQGEEGDDEDDIDSDLEPEPEMMAPAPHLGVLPPLPTAETMEVAAVIDASPQANAAEASDFPATALSALSPSQ